MIKQRHHLRDINGAATEAADAVGGQIVGDAAGLAVLFHAAQRLDHFGTRIASQKRHDIAAPHFSAQRQGFGGEEVVERLKIDLGAFKLRPRILEMIGRVGAADDVHRQAARRLEPREGFERRGGEYTAEIKNDRFNHGSPRH